MQPIRRMRQYGTRVDGHMNINTALGGVVLELIVNVQTYLTQRWRDIREDGATAVEYALLMGLLMIAIIAGATKYNIAVNKSYNSITNSIADAVDNATGP